MLEFIITFIILYFLIIAILSIVVLVRRYKYAVRYEKRIEDFKKRNSEN